MADGFSVSVDARQARLKFEVMPDKVRQALFTTSQALEAALLDKVRSRASGGLVGVKTGEYLQSLKGSTRQGKNSVTATTRSKSPLAAIIEYGADIPAHDILPDAKRALHFGGGAGEVFAAVVHHPAVALKPKPVITGAFDEMKSEIVSGLERAATEAARESFR